jgi:hypothetical protein
MACTSIIYSFYSLRSYIRINTRINFSACSVQSWRRAETPKWGLAYFSQTKSSRRRNGEIKTERQRVSRDLAVRRVVLPGWEECMVHWSNTKMYHE